MGPIVAPCADYGVRRAGCWGHLLGDGVPKMSQGGTTYHPRSPGACGPYLSPDFEGWGRGLGLGTRDLGTLLVPAGLAQQLVFFVLGFGLLLAIGVPGVYGAVELVVGIVGR